MEPAAGRRAPVPHLRRVGPCRGRRRRRPGPPRRRQGRCGLPAAAVVASTTPSSTRALLRLGAITSGINPRMGAGRGGLHPRAGGAGARGGRSRGGGAAAHRHGGVEVVERAEVATWWAGDPPRPVARPRVPHDPVAVVWTSGTTGKPKGALFDHANLAAVARGTDVLSQPGDRRLSPLPFAHVGYMTRAWDEIANGVTTVITPTPWRADDAVRIMAAESVTVAQGVPTQWALMLASPELARRRPQRAAGRQHRARRACRPHWSPTMRRRFGRARRGALHLHRGVARDRHHADVVRRGGGHDRGAPRAGRRAGHRRRRRETGARRVDRPGPAALGGHHARLLGARPGPGSPRRAS